MHRTLRSASFVPALAGLAVIVPAISAQDPAIQRTIVVLEGQTITGVGDVTSVSNVAVNASGDTLVEIDTNNPDTDTDSVVLSNGAVFLREGQALGAPAGSTLDTFDSVVLNDLGNSSFNLFLDGTSGSGDDSGVYFGSSLLAQEGTFATAAGFSPMTPLIGFFDTKLNDSNLLLVMASVDDPAVNSTVDRALMTIDEFGTQTLFMKEGDVVPGVPGVFVSDFATAAEGSDLNDAGQILYFIDSDAATSEDGFVFLDSTQLAREGQPSPVAGRNWSSLSSPELSLNADGDYVHSGSLDGDTASNLLLVKNGAKFRQEGDALPATGGFTFTSFGSAPLLVADRGAPDADPDVLWYGDWNDTDTDVDTGLFLDGKIVVQEGVTTIDGMVVDTIGSFSETLDFSSNGRYALADLTFEGSLDAAVLLDFGPWVDVGNGTPGTTAPKLRGFGQLTPGAPTTVSVSGAPAGTTGVLVIGFSRIDQPFMGGTLVPSPDRVLFGEEVDADGNFELRFDWPAGFASGSNVYVQFWAFDGGAPNGFSVTNGVEATTP